MFEICRLCGSNTEFLMRGRIIDKYDIAYYDCPCCGYVQTEKPYWLSEAYMRPINESDTGIISRNYQNVKILYFLLFYIFRFDCKKIIHLDYASGYGLLVGLMRELGFKSYWDDRYCDNIFAKNFIYNKSIQKVSVLSAFEVFEHLEKPITEIGELLSISNNLIFTTTLIGDKAKSISDWWYYGIDHGQHIGFYREKTLNFIANKYNLNLYTNGSTIHCFTRNDLSPIIFKCISFVARLSMIAILKKIKF